MNIILFLGIALLSGLGSGWLFKLIKIPRVVGYMTVGLIFGNSFLNIISLNMVGSLAPMTDIALSFMGFMIGGELKKAVFQRFGTQMIIIMLAEGLLAFMLVTLIITLFTHNLALGILLGALASATAPAATVDVLWEYKSKGPLTTTILGIVALDDGLSLILFGFSLAFARVLLEGESLSFMTGLFDPLVEILGSLGLGIFAGWILCWALRRITDREGTLVLVVGMVFLLSGLAHWLNLSLILVQLAFGAALVNLAPNSSRTAFELVKTITPPIFIVFFILVGAQLRVSLLTQIGLLGVLYVGGRTLGKITGAWLGGVWGKAPPAVQKYLGFALFSQAGVAVGLSLAIAQEFGHAGPIAHEVGTLVVNIIAATTFLVQIIGPPFVKFAITRAGEIPDS